MTCWPRSPSSSLWSALERLAELVVSARNAALEQGARRVEYGAGHYPAMVALHTALLVGAARRGLVVADRPAPRAGLVDGGPGASRQALRWWCIRTLGRRWNTRVIVVPGLPLVTGGPYRWLRHPNYVAVVVEGVALPMVHTAWVTAIGFTVLNAVVLAVRIRVEDAALATAAGARGRRA